MKRLTATAVEREGRVVLASPSVGWWHPAVARGAVVRGGDLIGVLEVLGTHIDVVAPAGAGGAVVDGAAGANAFTAVGHGAMLLALDPRGGVHDPAEIATTTEHAKADGLVFTAPLSGRFFAKPGPGKPAFIKVGDEVGEGQTVCMLEVMKTFHRVTYGGGGLPARARVLAILVEDEADVTMGQAILHVEAL